MVPFDDFYETLIGVLIPEARVAGVENAFAPGEVCDLAYEDMRRAYERLLDRLGVRDEDPDLDTIVSDMEIIQKDLCRRMYRMGKMEQGIHGAVDGKNNG